jgi:raffinose/stachyose/melibiose transport system substrate-binding protein
MSRRLFRFAACLMIAAMALGACATPTPEVVVQTQVVRETQLVPQTQIVAQTQVVRETQVVEVTAAPVEKKLVELAGFYPYDSPWGKQLRLVGLQLEAENPECKFAYTEYPGAEAYKTVALRAQEGDPPDIFAGGADSLQPGGGEAWQAGLIYDLAADMQTPPYGATEGTWFDTFNAAAQKQMEFDGHIGSVPYMQTQIVVWYNTKLYAEHGLQAPTTWEELLANSEVLKNAGIASIGGGGFNGYLGYWYDMILFRLLGNDAQYGLYNNTDQALQWAENPEVIKAAEMLVDLVEQDYTVPGWVGGDFTANQVAYFTGQAAHIFIGTWLMGEMKDSVPADFEQAVIYFPTVEGYEDKTPYEAAFGFLNVLGIYKPGANASEEHSTECAVKYLKLFTSVQYQTEAAASLDYVSTIEGVPGPQNIPGIGDLLSDMQLWFPAFQNLSYTAPELRTKMWDNVALLAAGELTPAEFAEKQQADWDEYFSR